MVEHHLDLIVQQQQLPRITDEQPRNVKNQDDPLEEMHENEENTEKNPIQLLPPVVSKEVTIESHLEDENETQPEMERNLESN